jgi:hypothetical protein
MLQLPAAIAPAASTVAIATPRTPRAAWLCLAVAVRSTPLSSTTGRIRTSTSVRIT